jgi:hypothetical protein
MKNKYSIALIAAVALSAPLAMGQVFNFTVNGIVNPGDEHLLGQLSSEFNVSVTDNGVLTTIDVKVTNTSSAPSALTAWYLQKPANTTYLGGGALADGTPADWTADDELGSFLQEFGGSHDADLYFGAQSGTRLDSQPVNEFGEWSFVFFNDNPGSPVFNENAYFNSGNPLVFARWQAVVINDQLNDESGKGGWGPGFDPSVPEPSEVAALAMLGLGGILFARRRFTKKK